MPKRGVNLSVNDGRPSSPKRVRATDDGSALIENVHDENGHSVRDITQHVEFDRNSGKFCTIMSWNVAGLRALINNSPVTLLNLIKKHSPDVICLQETKLQPEHLPDHKDTLLVPDYVGFWSCSTVKKGYSGVVIFVRASCINNIPSSVVSSIKGPSFGTSLAATAKQSTLMNMWSKKSEPNNSVESPKFNGDGTLNVLSVQFDCADAPLTEAADPAVYGQYPPSFIPSNPDSAPPSSLCPGEGRTITIEFPQFYVIGCYVPNSGQDLQRLSYRVDTWDPAMRAYLQTLQLRKPVVFLGDLNVGYFDIDIHNPKAKHIVKQAGLTPQERESHTLLVNAGRTGFVDAFRYLYPSARGNFTYFSRRTFAIRVNNGLRIDYFMCSKSMTACYDSHDDVPQSDEVDAKGRKTLTARKKTVGESVAGCSHFPRIIDSYVAADETGELSDHIPLFLVLQLS